MAGGILCRPPATRRDPRWAGPTATRPAPDKPDRDRSGHRLSIATEKKTAIFGEGRSRKRRLSIRTHPSRPVQDQKIGRIRAYRDKFLAHADGPDWEGLGLAW